MRTSGRDTVPKASSSSRAGPQITGLRYVKYCSRHRKFLRNAYFHSKSNWAVKDTEHTDKHVTAIKETGHIATVGRSMV